MGVTRPARAVVAALLLSVTAPQVGCGFGNTRAAVNMRMSRTRETPRDASVYIDEEYIGPLGYVARHNVRLPVGEHRISVVKEGYFPWDELVTADREGIRLRVELIPIPD